MAFDDPIVWVLIVTVVVFLFGSSKIPSIAKAIGQARREFDSAVKGVGASAPIDSGPLKMQNTTVSSPPTSALVGATTSAVDSPDPLVEAAQKEGIDTRGKTKQQIATELSWKLNNH